MWGFFLAFQVYLTAGKTYQLEKTLKELEEGAQHCGTTDSELSELEDKVASAAAQVQQAESEVRAWLSELLCPASDSKRSQLWILWPLSLCFFPPSKDIRHRISNCSSVCCRAYSEVRRKGKEEVE